MPLIPIDLHNPADHQALLMLLGGLAALLNALAWWLVAASGKRPPRPSLPQLPPMSEASRHCPLPRPTRKSKTPTKRARKIVPKPWRQRSARRGRARR